MYFCYIIWPSSATQVEGCSLGVEGMGVCVLRTRRSNFTVSRVGTPTLIDKGKIRITTIRVTFLPQQAWGGGGGDGTKRCSVSAVASRKAELGNRIA